MENIPTRKVKWHKKNLSVAQVPSEGLEYAFVSKKYEQVHQLVWCKDFMQDCIYGQINQVKTKVYGFVYDPETSPEIDLKKTRIMISNYKDKEFEQKVFNCLDFLNQIETKLKMAKTYIERCDSPPVRYKKAGVWILNGSKRWMKSPPLISLYTLLIRVGLMHESGTDAMETLNKMKSGDISPYYQSKLSQKDSHFLNDASRGIDKIINKGDRKIFGNKIEGNYPSRDIKGYPLSVMTFHDDYGIVGFSRENTKDQFPKWHKVK